MRTKRWSGRVWEHNLTQVGVEGSNPFARFGKAPIPAIQARGSRSRKQSFPLGIGLAHHEAAHRRRLDSGGLTQGPTRFRMG